MSADQGRRHRDSLLVEGVPQPNRVASKTPVLSGKPGAALVGCIGIRWCGGFAMGSKHGTIEQRFWPKVKKSDGCWLWTAGHDSHGYGQIAVGQRTVGASRVAWELTYGSIPDRLWVLHKCDNPPCVRPDHLFLGTNGDNVRDRNQKGRANYACGPRNGRSTHPERTSQGERHPSAKLTASQVLNIRERYASGNCSYMTLATEFGVHNTTILMVVQRRKWKSL